MSFRCACFFVRVQKGAVGCLCCRCFLYYLANSAAAAAAAADTDSVCTLNIVFFAATCVGPMPRTKTRGKP